MKLNQYIYLTALMFFCSTSFADSDAREVVEKFMRDSIEHRLSYLYRNKFFRDSNRENLYILAEKACKELDAVISVYRLEQRQIVRFVVVLHGAAHLVRVFH